MIQAVKSSTEAGHLKAEALKYLTGLKGTLVQKKKKKAEEKQQAKAGAASSAAMQQMPQVPQMAQMAQMQYGAPPTVT